MSQQERIVYLANIERLEAQEEIRRGNVPDNRVYNVVLAATGSKDEASKALSARIAWQQERGRTPDVGETGNEE